MAFIKEYENAIPKSLCASIIKKLENDLGFIFSLHWNNLDFNKQTHSPNNNNQSSRSHLILKFIIHNLLSS